MDIEHVVSRIIAPLAGAAAAYFGYMTVEQPTQTQQMTNMVASLVEYHLDEQAKAVAAALETCEVK